MTSQSSELESTKLEFPFGFPFPPYDIQLKLMKVAYDTYEASKFALLESPTGTGKSLSLICSALTWLRDHQSKVKSDLESRKEELESRISELKKEEKESGDWLDAQFKRKNLDNDLVEVKSDLEQLDRFEQRSIARLHARTHNVPLENYSVMSDIKPQADKNKVVDSSIVSPNIIGSQSSQGSQVEGNDEDIEKKVQEQTENYLRPKVFYASRTHSQLSQFINEIKRTKFADSTAGHPIKVTPLASRANMCVNPEVYKLRDPNAINERCAELQRETDAKKKCSYAKAKQVSMLKEDILTSVQDIEDIVGRGRVMGSCPYYATRMSVAEAEVVVLPYNNLLHHETRKASSLDLKDSIVIVDEAHNILETICSIHSAQITGQQLIGSHTILSRYYNKFHTRMTPRNAGIIKIIVQCLSALIRYLNEPQKHLADYEAPKSVDLDTSVSSKVNDKTTSGDKRVGKQFAKHEELMTDVLKFIGTSNIEQFNVFKILDYINRSQLARKLLGFFRQDSSLDLSIDLLDPTDKKSSEDLKLKEKNGSRQPAKKKLKTTDKQSTVGKNFETIESSEKKPQKTNLMFLKLSNADLDKKDLSLTSYPVYNLVEFLKSLTNLAQDGKVLTHHIKGDIQQSILKFLLLNPSSQFKQMVQEARSIVLAGGTMQPFSEFVDLLFGPLGIEKSRLTLFSCGHVIGADQLYVTTLSNGSTGKPVELSFKTRSSFETIDEIGRTIMTLSSIAPGGMVCFFPSYDYEQLCFNRWTQIGVIRNIETRSKQVFREPRQSNHMKPILDEYSRVVEKTRGTKRGAMLMSVVGGKMSEGINFNDDLGRLVVMVGLPYANIRSGELQQKMAHYDRTCQRERGETSAGQQYYENLCIKGINQSIGRAVRHRRDYAAIILLDRRYASKESIRKGLPEWMRQSIVDHERFGPMFAQLKSFYDDISSRNC